MTRAPRQRWLGRAAAATVTAGLLVAATHSAGAQEHDPAQPQPATGLADPAGAAPDPTANLPADQLGPDAGALPPADAPVPLPTIAQPAAARPVTALGPLAAEIMATTSRVERLGEQLKQLDQQVLVARAATAEAYAPWIKATADLQAARQRAVDVAADAYKSAAHLGPLQPYANDLQELGAVAPGLDQQLGEAGRPAGRDSVGRDLDRALQVEKQTKTTYDAASTVETELTVRQSVVREQYGRQQQALRTLRQRNAKTLPKLDEAREAYEADLGVGFNVGGSVNGWSANPRALTAVQYALSQLGKPYVWAAEGPDSYDCSGLTYAAYGSVGVGIPRVANDQYHGLTPVLVNQLLPGDLLFFSTDRSDWRAIHHVAMYLGNGQMVHSPTFGETVKVAPIWWSEYFGAARVLPAVTGPGATPTIPNPKPTKAPSRPPATPPARTTPAPGSTRQPTAKPTIPSVPSSRPQPTTPPATVPTTPAPTTRPAPATTTPADTTPAPASDSRAETPPAGASGSSPTAPADLPPATTGGASGSSQPRRVPRQRRR